MEDARVATASPTGSVLCDEGVAVAATVEAKREIASRSQGFLQDGTKPPVTPIQA